MHSQRGRGIRTLGGSEDKLFRRVSDCIPGDVLERQDVIQILCMSLLSGTLTWQQFTKNKTAVLREAKRVMLYSGMLADIALVSLNKPIEPDEDVEFGDFLV